MFTAFLIKYAEIGVKGKNRHLFEEALVRRIEFALDKVGGRFMTRRTQGRIYIDVISEMEKPPRVDEKNRDRVFGIEEREFDFDETVERLQKVFGISGICPVVYVEDKGFEALSEDVIRFVDEVYPDKKKTFKVHARRARKNYPKDTMELNADLGEVLLNAFPELSVDVHKPDFELNVEIREKIYIYSTIIPGPGGMPVGTGGKAMLLLSGGIDSPVAGYMISKRGVELEAVYFHAPPYTSERAKQKVVDLAEYVSDYAGPMKLHVVNFTDIQLYIYEKCPHDELTIIMRRYMMRIAEAIAAETDCMGLVTGESIGQVASQTMQALMCTNEVCELPVYRPLIAFDKQDIVDISEKIDTYETSIQPYEDCCTIFVAKHPVTKPNRNVIRIHEQNLEEKIDELVAAALNTREVIEIKGRPVL